MNLPTFINKWIIGYKPIMYSPFWWWFRLMSHEGFRFDDYHIWKEFWSSLNGGWLDMNYKWEFEKFWGKGAKAEKVILSPEDFDALQKRLAEPPDPAIMESVKRLMNRKTPFEND